jgi:proton glutamate symport protein
MLKKLPLWASILIAMVLGVVYVFFAIEFNGLQHFTTDYIRPFGVIFIKLLKLMAMPLIFFSLVNGIAGMKNISDLSKLGWRTLIMYVLTTFIAIVIGLSLANIIKPGEYAKIDFSTLHTETFTSKLQATDNRPLGFLEDLVPENIVSAASDNKNMLQVIFFAFLFGIALVKVEKSKASFLKNFIESVNDVIMKMIDIIMKYAPIGVFALIADVLLSFSNKSGIENIFVSLLVYSLTVIAGLFVMIFVIYPSLLKIFTKRNPFDFLKKILPAQLLAFSTSSSAATLPVTMDICENDIKISKEISSFVLPIGATINMDGTSLYQSVAALFIAQLFGIHLGFGAQLTIVLTALLASIGAAAVPGAGMVMLIIVLNSVGLPNEGIAIILTVDRLLDMLRTSVNVTSDATVATIINDTMKK